jgi:hypothetical protein
MSHFLVASRLDTQQAASNDKVSYELILLRNTVHIWKASILEWMIQ